MKNEKISRRSFLKASAVASALGVMAAAPAAHAAGADEAAAQIEEENCLLKKPKYIFLFIGDGMGTAQIQSARFYKGTVDNNGAVTAPGPAMCPMRPLPKSCTPRRATRWAWCPP